MRSPLQKEDAHLGISFLALLLPLLLYLLRNLDDNRLTSWSWVFMATSPGRLYAILVLLVVVLHLLYTRFPSGSPTGKDARPAQDCPGRNRLSALLLIAFLVCPLFWTAPEVIVDASRYLTQAKMLAEYGLLFFFQEWGREIFVWTDLPLIPFLYGLVFNVLGESRIAIQILNAAFFSLTALLTFTLGKELWDERTGRDAGLLLLGFPFLFSQVPLFLVDVGTMFFVLLALVAIYMAVSRGGAVRIALAASAIFCAVFVKFSAWVLLTAAGPVILYGLCSLGKQWRTGMLRAVLAVLPALIATSVVFWLYRDVLAAQLELLTQYQRPGLRRWGESLISTFFFQTHPLLTIAALYSVYRAWRNRDGRLLVVAYLIIVLLVFLEIRRSRYSIPLFPLVALLAAYGIQDLADPKVRRHLVATIVLPSLLLAWGAFLPFLKSMGERNIQEAGAYLNTLQGESIQVIVPASEHPVLDQRVYVPLLDLFTHKQLRYRPTPGPEPDPSYVAVSPLRFTWEFPMPRTYHAENAQERTGVTVVIGNSAQPALAMFPGEFQGDGWRATRFDQTSGIFQSRTVVTIYEPRP